MLHSAIFIALIPLKQFDDFFNFHDFNLPQGTNSNLNLTIFYCSYKLIFST